MNLKDLMKNKKEIWYYGMKRYFGINCQPKGSLDTVSEKFLKNYNSRNKTKFKDIVRYSHKLSEQDTKKFELKEILKDVK